MDELNDKKNIYWNPNFVSQEIPNDVPIVHVNPAFINSNVNENRSSSASNSFNVNGNRLPSFTNSSNVNENQSPSFTNSSSVNRNRSPSFTNSSNVNGNRSPLFYNSLSVNSKSRIAQNNPYSLCEGQYYMHKHNSKINGPSHSYTIPGKPNFYTKNKILQTKNYYNYKTTVPSDKSNKFSKYNFERKNNCYGFPQNSFKLVNNHHSKNLAMSNQRAKQNSQVLKTKDSAENLIVLSRNKLVRKIGDEANVKNDFPSMKEGLNSCTTRWSKNNENNVDSTEDLIVVSRNKLVRKISSEANVKNGFPSTKKGVNSCTTRWSKNGESNVKQRLSSPKIKHFQSKKMYKPILPQKSVHKKINNKYSIYTRTKVVRRKSLSKMVKTSPYKASPISCTKDYLPNKYSLISKTKLVRKRSSNDMTINLIRPAEEQHRKSLAQKTAKGIMCKYRLKRLRGNYVNRTNIKKNSFQSKPNVNRTHSHRYVNIEGNVYKSTKMSLKKQNLSPNSTPSKSQRKFAKSHLSKNSDTFINIQGILYKSTKLSLHRQTISTHKSARFSSAKYMNSLYKNNRKPNYPNKKQVSDNFINIGGILYKSTKNTLQKHTIEKNKLTNNTLQKHNIGNKKPYNRNKKDKCIIHLRGAHFSVSSDGKNLKRIGTSAQINKLKLPHVHIGGLTYSQTNAGNYELTKYHRARQVVNTAKQRSLAILSRMKNNKYCLFYNRFGSCSKNDNGKCSYIHDPEKVAVCTRFLRGRCNGVKCAFSHKVNPAKMPVCSYFLRTSCSRENCPYSHVRVNPGAPICLSFLAGFCPKGEECKQQHILECDVDEDGNCPRGKTCPLRHRKKANKKLKATLVHKEKNKKNYVLFGSKSGSKVSTKDSKNTNVVKRYFKPDKDINKEKDAKKITENNNRSFYEKLDEAEFNKKKERVLAKIDKLISPLKSKAGATERARAVVNNEDVDDGVKLQFKPFVGPLPDFIPLSLE